MAEAKSERITSHSSAYWIAVITALATIAVAGASLYQSCTNARQLSLMEDEVRLVHGGRVVLIPMFPEDSLTTRIKRIGQENETWQLPYTVLNVGNQPVEQLIYCHAVDHDSAFAVPPESLWQQRWSLDILQPGQSWPCGYDVLYRQEVLDGQSAGNVFYRHFAVKYVDEFGFESGFFMSLKLEYEMGKFPQWSQIAYRRLDDLR